VSQFVAVLRYNLEGRGFCSQWCHLLNPSGSTKALSSTKTLTEMSTIDVPSGAKGGRCVGLKMLSHSYADCLEILESSSTWNPPKGLFRLI